MRVIHGYQTYKKISTLTATPAQLVLMLYNGAIKYLEQALRGFEKEDPLEFNLTINNNILKAQEIINELNNALDIENGGEVAANFRRLYDYFDYRLTESNTKKDPTGIRDVLNRLIILRDAWQQMMSQTGLFHEATFSNSS